jgi:hypothetical protein
VDGCPSEEISMAKGSLTRIETKIDNMSKGLMKIVYSLIGVIAATVGSNFVHSPIHVIITSYFATFGAAFVVASVIHRWKLLTHLNRALRLVFSSFILWSTICRDMIISAPPEWYGIVINVFFTVLSIILVAIVWREK